MSDDNVKRITETAAAVAVIAIGAALLLFGQHQHDTAGTFVLIVGVGGYLVV